MAFDTRRDRPPLSRMCEGAALDAVDVRDLLAQARFEGVVFVLDHGFCSEENVALLTERAQPLRRAALQGAQDVQGGGLQPRDAGPLRCGRGGPRPPSSSTRTRRSAAGGS